MSTTYYELLEVSPDATTDEIRSAYRAKVKETHPDVSDAPDAADRFQRVQRAREVLTDDAKRDRYDRLGHDAYVDGIVDPATEAGTAAGDARPDATDTGPGATDGPTASDGAASAAGSDDASGGAAAEGAAAGAATDATASDWRAAEQGRSWRADDDTRREGREPTSGGGTAYATRTSASHRSYDGLRVPLTPRTAITLLTTFVLYPVFVFSSVLPRFPLTVNIVLALCTLFVIAYLVSMPEIAIVVFGTWSVLTPLLLLTVDWLSLFSLVGMVALVASWFPLGLALLARSALRL